MAREAIADSILEVYYNDYKDGVSYEKYNKYSFKEFLKYLIEAAGQEDDDIREKIVSEFRSMNKPYFTDVFVEKLRNSTNEHVREYSAEMLLEQECTEEEIDALLEALEDPSPRVRKAVVKTMGEFFCYLKPEDRPKPEENPFTYKLIKTLGDKDQSFREAILEALEAIGVTKSLAGNIAEALRASMEKEAKKHLTAVEIFLKLLNSEKPSIRVLAILSLAYLGDTGVVDTLKNYLNDKDRWVQEVAKGALQMIDEKKNGE